MANTLPDARALVKQLHSSGRQSLGLSAEIPRAMAVNVGAGTVLFVIGLAMLWIGRRVRRKVSRGDR